MARSRGYLNGVTFAVLPFFTRVVIRDALATNYALQITDFIRPTL